MEYILYLHRVFHGIKFKVNRRLVVGMTTIFLSVLFAIMVLLEEGKTSLERNPQIWHEQNLNRLLLVKTKFFHRFIL